MKKIVFDLDDTLWSLCRRVASLTGVKYNDLVTFSIFDNPLLTDDDRARMLDAFNNAETFENIQWYEGVSDIMKLEQYGAEVYINSNCNIKEVADVKRRQLHELLDIPDERIILNVTSEHTKKDVGDDVYIFVDDSPHNMLYSNAKHKIMLDCPWNINCTELKKQHIVSFSRFDYICDYIKTILGYK